MPDAQAHQAQSERSTTGATPLVVVAAHLGVLWALAVAQPLFDVLDDGPEFFVARGSERLDILLFAFGLVLVPPAFLAAVEGALRLVRPTLAQAWHTVNVVGLVWLLAVQVIGAVADMAAGVVLAGALVLALTGARLYAGHAAVRSFLTVLSPAPFVFLALFLTGPVGTLLWEDTSAAAPSRPVSADAPVVFVVFDELPVMSLMKPDGQVNGKRFPNFARLARESTWFRNTTTVHGQTSSAVPAILTGRLPADRHALPITRHHPDNLFTLLGSTYRVDAAEAITRLCPHAVCHRATEPLGERLRLLTGDTSLIYLHALLPESIATHLPHVTDTWVDFRGQESDTAEEKTRRRTETVDDLVRDAFSDDPKTRFESFIVRQPQHARRTLLYLHALLPHAPFKYLPSGDRYASPPVDGLVDEQWGDAAVASRVAQQRHLLQLGYTDRLLGRLLARLRAHGTYDESAIVVVADHGASFRPGGTRRGLTATTLADIAFVPFFLKSPHQRVGRAIGRHIRTVDVLPTLADSLNIDLGWRHEGRSGLAPERGSPTVRVRDGDDVSGPYSTLLRRRDAAVARQAHSFGAGGFDERFYALGGHAELIGAHVATTAARATDVSVNLEHSEAWAAGRLSGPGARPGIKLAVAVGGRIAGTTSTYADGADVVFALMTSVRGGPGEDVRIFRIGDDPLSLVELPQA